MVRRGLLHGQEPVGAEVGAEHFREKDGSVFLEMLFQKGDHETRQGHARAVERVDELRLAVRVLEAAVQAAGLVVGEAAARADLQPLLLAGRPELEVVALGGREAHVAGREHQYAEVESKAGEHLLGLVDERLELLERGGGVDEVDHFHLVELVDAEHAARHLTGAAGLAAVHKHL